MEDPLCFCGLFVAFEARLIGSETAAPHFDLSGRLSVLICVIGVYLRLVFTSRFMSMQNQVLTESG